MMLSTSILMCMANAIVTLIVLLNVYFGTDEQPQTLLLTSIFTFCNAWVLGWLIYTIQTGGG